MKTVAIMAVNVWHAVHGVADLADIIIEPSIKNNKFRFETRGRSDKEDNALYVMNIEDIGGFEYRLLSDRSKKLPIGIMPRHIYNDLRAKEIIRAMGEFMECGEPIKAEWVEELSDLVLNVL